ncbi:MAG: MarR family transcriptional regulator [Candidatus Latescibacteria bacterium]|nr:MarR family transcriptional regulator [Candidatus Latescibacterota bacterium]NIO00959.1 MarR family transcriptional regulator [Candidatus Latescibacterota bacterium]NIO27358.1 MarR family transcriptional regulator [Candidatus Latescibacterota bacterium]NIO54880.1 MarR family transcriptional regulator [Candidatus Latescibacterota bacterium]NIT00969.1 MarR family transcriptional regulator [Candidatus Latescibacterota bacterium]
MLSHAMENYLKVIYEILERHERATTSMIAEQMGIASPSVTSMIKKLADLGLVTHTPYQGVSLTKVGEKASLEIIRHHRLLELYLAEALDVPWDRVHEEAEKLEHVLSENLEDRISAVLGNPTVDPHGAPIPSKDGSIHRVGRRRLTDVEPGNRVEMLEVGDRDPELLRYLGMLNLYPGTKIDVVSIEPYGGPLVLRVDGRDVQLGQGAAKEILVTE